MTWTGLTVSDLAREAGVSPHTVRFYEQVGLLPVPARSDSGYRLYDPSLVDRLRFIRGAKRLGLRLDDMRNCSMSWTAVSTLVGRPTGFCVNGSLRSTLR